MYSGSRVSQALAQLARELGAELVGDDVGDQPAVPRRVLARHDHAPRRTAGCSRERGLDLAELDAEAADLDLVVERGRGTRASPSGRQRAEVAGAVQPRARLAGERVGHEALGGQLGPVEVAAGDAAPPM